MREFIHLLKVAQDRYHQCTLQLPLREEVKVHSKHMAQKNIYCLFIMRETYENFSHANKMAYTLTVSKYPSNVIFFLCKYKRATCKRN